jgi:hypothetical protein
MQKLWAIVQREYLERVRTRWFAIATVFGPIVFGALMYLPAYAAMKSNASVRRPRAFRFSTRPLRNWASVSRMSSTAV